MKYASEILQIASNLVSGDRQKQHGDKITNHKNIATLWSAYLDKDITGHDVAILMSLLINIHLSLNTPICGLKNKTLEK